MARWAGSAEELPQSGTDKGVAGQLKVDDRAVCRLLL